MRITKLINRDWKYSPNYSAEYIKPDFEDSGWSDIGLPHSNVELPYNGFDEKLYQIQSCYRRKLEVSPEWLGRRIALHFEGVMVSCTVWINGREAGSHNGGFTSFDVEIGEFVTPGPDNTVAVMVDSRELPHIPPFGKVVDFLCYGGIYREVSLVVTNPCHIENFRLLEFIEDIDGNSARLLYCADIAGQLPADSCLKLSISSDGGELVSRQFTEPDGLVLELPGVELWSPESPYLYDVKLELLSADGRSLDVLSRRSGFRHAHFHTDGFYLNGERRTVIGLNRHQSFPYIGYAMPERAQRRDADILKYELGVDIVRTSHYPQSRHFLDRCDEIGLLVMEEIPGWQHIGGDEWKEQSIRDTRDMVRAHAHHPAIVLWGVRINESSDDSELYAATNKAARELDPVRQTGGVRNFAGSEFLEDVYTFNDFNHNGVLAALRPRQKVAGGPRPYLVTEHSGHMYPTKRFDQEERLVEHSLRHLRVMDAAYARDSISGAIGWCAFDYNTHREFGSGDRICYHGVMDMFRIPKFAAAAYASQKSPAAAVVMEPLSYFALGERDEAKSLPLYVLTNCDFVRVERNGKFIGDFYPGGGEFPHLPHPPVKIPELVGDRLDGHGFSAVEIKRLKKYLAVILEKGSSALKWYQWISMGLIFLSRGISFVEAERIFNHASTGWGDGEQCYRIAGYIAGEERVAGEYGSSVPSSLSIAVDELELKSGDWDCTRVEFRLVDQYGNICPYVNEYIELEIDGEGMFIGPVKSAMIGGVFAAWVKSSGRSGSIRIRGRCGRFDSKEISISVT